MAKKKGATGRDRGSKKKAGKKGVPKRATPQPNTGLAGAEKTGDTAAQPEAVTPAAEAGSRADETDQGLADGIAITPVATAAFHDKGLEALQASVPAAAKEALSELIRQTISPALKRLEEGVSDLYSKIDDIPRPPDQGSVASQAAAMARKEIEREKLRIRREEMWNWEAAAGRGRNSAPRPSILGRAIHELQTLAKGQPLTPAAIFQRVAEQGPHHLSKTIHKLLKKYWGPDNKVNKDVSGKLGTQLRKRLKGLKSGNYVEFQGKSFCLTTKGLATFSGWPDWGPRDDDVRDEDHVADATAEPLAGATDGSAGGTSE